MNYHPYQLNNTSSADIIIFDQGFNPTGYYSNSVLGRIHIVHNQSLRLVIG